MTDIIVGDNTRAAIARYKEQNSELGFCWPQLFEAEHGRPPNEEEIRRRIEEIAVMEKQRVKEQEQKDRLERQAHEDVTVEVSVCHQCNGAIMYRSRFVSAVSRSEMIVGPSRNPVKEECTVSCCVCGLMYSPQHVPFRKKLEEYRQRLD